MNSSKRMVVFLVAAPLLAMFLGGCGDFWQPPNTTGGNNCTTNCTTATSGNFYILNAGTTPEVVGDSVVTGSLTSISGSPWALPATPYAMTIDPAGNFLVVSTTSGVFSYPLNGGVLGTPVQVSTDQAYAVQVDTTGSWLLEAIPGTGGVTLGAVPIVTTTGASNGSEQTASFTIANASLQPGQMAISGDDAHIFLSMGLGGTLIATFNSAVASGSNPFSSTASTVPVAVSGGSALSVAVDPGTAPRLFYIGETLASPAGPAGGVRAYNYSSLGSTLTQASGSPIASGGLAPNFILPTTSGEYVYVANGQGSGSAGAINGLTITSSGTTTVTYSIAAGASVAAGVQPLGMAEDSTGAFVFEVGSLGSPYFEAYTFDTTTLGQLDAQFSSTTSNGAVAVVAAP